ncbi:hypothetical protein [Dysgonomonas sp. Marseille-P4361]|uniref:hypothetical protein n=1 Tax=Dysgonomonas sp. Marseille-P4361 TaxID=2161820 RepID=UPI000D557017|nr:hypothetical protein [Dysgonomonas sp. Marseille-P4361]
MKAKRNKMHCIIYRLRKSGGVKIDTRNRNIIYKYQQDEDKMQNKQIVRLCKEFGFARQAEI